MRSNERLIEDARDAQVWTAHPDPDIRELAEAMVAKGEAVRREVEAVRAARRGGISWYTIGEVLGVTRQSAARQYGDPK